MVAQNLLTRGKDREIYQAEPGQIPCTQLGKEKGGLVGWEGPWRQTPSEETKELVAHVKQELSPPVGCSTSSDDETGPCERVEQTSDEGSEYGPSHSR